MKRILMVATGGTIASRPTASGLRPEITPDEILQIVPGIAKVCTVNAIHLLDLDSTNMRPQNWQQIADCIEENYDSYDGFVVTHGTDTMAYTAGALTYLIQNAQKPIVLTGSQKSICMEESDARRNLLDAFLYAADPDSFGITVVFDGKVIPGARARKVRTKSWNAFSSIDYPMPAVIQDGRILRYFKEPRPQSDLRFYRKLKDRVFVLKLIPGLDSRIFDYLQENYDALVIESFGMGGLPFYGDEGFLNAIERWCAAGKTVVMTTQVPHEGSDMEIYQVGLRVKEKYEILEAYNMTLEAVVTKLMWILAQTDRPERVRSMFYTPIAHDLLTYRALTGNCE